ncbi:MAG: hypothetical protein JEY79_06600 [Pseudodesulfovibrio sp.]|nr:hypothetical protein [Pseudodesulfovibrio sp.]
MNFHNFIITRFNVNIYPIDFPERLEDTWLSLRFELFQKYCFPTVQAQQEQDFSWLVLFDEQTPAYFLGLIRAFSGYHNFVPVYCGAYETIMPTVVDHMQKIAPDSEWFVTTRLDNDDALSVGFVRCLHEIVDSLDAEGLKPSDKLYINFPNGLQLHDGCFYDFKDVTNAFVSLVERRENPHTVFWVDHPAIYDVAPVIQAETQPLWLQNVHDINVYNYVRGQRIDGNEHIRFFPCDFS